MPYKGMANQVIRMTDGTNNLYPIASKLVPKVLGSGDNLNTLYSLEDSGFYQITTGVANAPVTWCKLIVIGGAGCAQLIIEGNALYYRMYTGNPARWTSWRYLAGTAV